MRLLLKLLPLALLVFTPAVGVAQDGSVGGSANIAGVSAADAAGVPSAEAAAITATALDYIDGWYTGDAERMERALHPDLAKRIVETGGERGDRVEHMGALTLVQATRKGFGKSTPAGRRQNEVAILDVFGNAASVKVVAADWIDYLHMAKVDGRWVIVNVLWEMKPDRG